MAGNSATLGVAAEVVTALDVLRPDWRIDPPEPPRPTATAYRDVTPEEAEKRAVAYLATLSPSVEGEKGSRELMSAAQYVCWGFDMGSERGCWLLMEHFNPKCIPPWSEAELRRACRNAVENPRMARGWLLHAPLPDRSRRRTPRPHPAAASPSAPPPAVAPTQVGQRSDTERR